MTDSSWNNNDIELKKMMEEVISLSLTLCLTHFFLSFFLILPTYLYTIIINHSLTTLLFFFYYFSPLFLFFSTLLSSTLLFFPLLSSWFLLSFSSSLLLLILLSSIPISYTTTFSPFPLLTLSLVYRDTPLVLPFILILTNNIIIMILKFIFNRFFIFISFSSHVWITIQSYSRTISSSDHVYFTLSYSSFSHISSITIFIFYIILIWNILLSTSIQSFAKIIIIRF